MGPVAFAEFCGKLKATGLLKDFRRATVEEQVAKFLQILGQNFRNRALEFFSHRSGETISHNFHNVLRAVVALEAEFLNQPTGADVPPQILNNNDSIHTSSEFNWANEVTDNNMNSPEPSLYSQATSSRGSKRKVSMMEMLEKQYERLNSGIERVSEVLERGNAIAEKSLAILESGRPHYYKEEELFTELELIGVHPNFVMTAYCYLSKNPSATMSFFGVPRVRHLE
ncbi:hypothetical protein GH714_030021 [Hevea brasiliensis]|uniref:DUF8040 domain-containing protein n=1 Tax=Hevea brasiliensis TaxID=3981 RepID=A0A6A6LP65_HEVBR|nr:hypothetical protein GH714_030021 [Hevea brasiliensis]